MCTHAKGKKEKEMPKTEMLKFKYNIYHQNGLVHYQALINLLRETLYNMLEDSLTTFMLNSEFLPKAKMKCFA